MRFCTALQFVVLCPSWRAVDYQQAEIAFFSLQHYSPKADDNAAPLLHNFYGNAPLAGELLLSRDAGFGAGF
jgi:hypothetical protein